MRNKGVFLTAAVVMLLASLSPLTADSVIHRGIDTCASSASMALQPLPALELPDLAGITGVAGSVPVDVCNRPCSTCSEADTKCNWDCRCQGLCAYAFQCYAANPCASVCICSEC
jgi:hypothetical protein